MEHVWLAAPFMIASWFVLAFNAGAFRALTLGEDAAASLGVNVERTRVLVVIGVALGVGAAVLRRGRDLICRPGRAASGAGGSTGPIPPACCCLLRLPARRC